jgi:hypothetical protein
MSYLDLHWQSQWHTTPKFSFDRSLAVGRKLAGLFLHSEPPGGVLSFAVVLHFDADFR